MSTVERDAHGQPLDPALNASRRTQRDVSELLGLAKGLLADGQVVEAEARYLRDWGASHPDAIEHWPVNLIFTRLNQFYADGHIDADEREELKDVLSALVGGSITMQLGTDGPSTLPLDTPPPLICWHQEVYVFTGKFAYGTRRTCADEVTSRGGVVEDTITRRTTFLVVGTFSSEDWEHTSYGRKIQRAAELRGSGFPLRIVGEDHWSTAL